MVAVNWAWETLGDPDRRSRYDLEHGIEPSPASAAPGSNPPDAGSAPTATPGAHPPDPWSARPSGAHGAGDPGSTGGAGGTTGTVPGTGGAAGPSGPVPGAGPGRPSSGGGRPPVQRRGADGRVVEWRNAPDGTGGAGEPPGRPTGSILPFGRFIAWSIGEIARQDPGYLEWLEGRPEGEPFRDEIDATLMRLGWRPQPVSRDQPRRWRG